MPPFSKGSWLRPFEISARAYRVSLDVSFPIIIAGSYALIVFCLNSVNRRRQNKPWRISQSPQFHRFVLLHNIGLSLFSAWVLYGLIRTLHASLPSPKQKDFFVRATTTLCHVEGSSGLRDTAADSGSDGLWQQGLGYFSWIMYMSKFYEAMDTFILLAKGKQSTGLQIYHHAGVMICAWALVRSMSPHCVVAALLNSGVHTLMYFYFFLRTAKITVPFRIKRALTTVQIAQFISGYVVSLCALFVVYEAPNYGASVDGIDVEPQQGSIHVRPCLHTPGHMATFLMGTVYLGFLVYLFVQLYVRSYLSKAKGKVA